ncbi:MAG: hypothetical protein U5K81_14465 [Trueperaceae bacterium]|nr:hypothetical protein [Trueperaceae bacterium]
MARPLPFDAGDDAQLLCVGTSLDVLHARLVDASTERESLSRRDARAVPAGRTAVIRTGISRELPVPGEWFTLNVEKTWRFGHTPYAKGEVTRCWRDLDAASLPDLRVEEHGTWTLERWLQDLGLTTDDLEPVYDVLRDGRVRREVELQGVLPDLFSPMAWEDDPILETIAWREMGEGFESEKRLCELTRQDLRCLDAHAHLGNQAFPMGEVSPRWWERARRHYLVGVDLAERVLREDDVTPKGLLDNRPYLRCLHGLGLATWALGDAQEGGRVFERLLRRDPSDGAGARFLLQAVRDGLTFEAFPD